MIKNENIFIINKPIGMTSNDVIQTIKHKLKLKKIGHGGTLDPLASGVLVIGINNGTKKLSEQLNAKKEYIAKIEFGYQTDTFDSEGKIINYSKKNNMNLEEINDVCNIWKKDSYLQKAPSYSSIKYKGKELYKYAREGIEVEPPYRKVEIFEYKFISFKDNILEVKILVSKGFYVRSFANDLGIKLGTFATLIGLQRTKSGEFFIEDAYEMKDFIEKYNKNDKNF